MAWSVRFTACALLLALGGEAGSGLVLPHRSSSGAVAGSRSSSGPQRAEPRDGAERGPGRFATQLLQSSLAEPCTFLHVTLVCRASLCRACGGLCGSRLLPCGQGHHAPGAGEAGTLQPRGPSLCRSCCGCIWLAFTLLPTPSNREHLGLEHYYAFF